MDRLSRSILLMTVSWMALVPATGGAAGRDEMVAPLRDFAGTLERRTSVRFRLARPEFGDHLVTGRVDDVPLEEALRTMLRGFSYVIDHGPGGSVVRVVAVKDGPALPASMPADEAATPRHSDRVGQILAELAAPLPDAREARLNELVGVADNRATAALADEARPDRPAGRIEAVHRLWRHAAALRFTDAATMSVLDDLSGDPDEPIASAARAALDDARAFHRSDAP